MEKEISSLELEYITKELQVLVDSRIDKIFMSDKKDMLLQLHKAVLGKVLLRLKTPNFLYLTKHKPEFDQPSNLCMALRKRINNARINSIEKISDERIIKISLSTKDKNYFLVFEFFLKGNILLLEEDGKIDLLAQNQSWSDRSIKIKDIYQYPEREIAGLPKKFDKPIVKFLAADMNLGGEFAEEVCIRSGVHKTNTSINASEEKALKIELEKLKSIETGIAYIYSKGSKTKILPLKFQSLIELGYEESEHESFNEALDSVFTTVLKSKTVSKADIAFQEKLKKAENIFNSQKSALEKHEKTILDSTAKGDLIYQHFAELTEILNQLKKARETMTWKELKEKLKGHKIIKKVNEKKGTMVIDLE